MILVFFVCIFAAAIIHSTVLDLREARRAEKQRRADSILADLEQSWRDLHK